MSFLCENCKNWTLVQEARRRADYKGTDDLYEWMECGQGLRGVFNHRCTFYSEKEEGAA